MLDQLRTHSIDPGPQSASEHKEDCSFDLRSTGGKREVCERMDEQAKRDGTNPKGFKAPTTVGCFFGSQMLDHYRFFFNLLKQNIGEVK